VVAAHRIDDWAGSCLPLLRFMPVSSACGTITDAGFRRVRSASCRGGRR
jgi:hypothetical protein